MVTDLEDSKTHIVDGVWSREYMDHGFTKSMSELDRCYTMQQELRFVIVGGTLIHKNREGSKHEDRRIRPTIGGFGGNCASNQSTFNNGGIEEWEEKKEEDRKGRRIAMVPPKVTPQLPKPEVKVEEKIVKAEHTTRCFRSWVDRWEYGRRVKKYEGFRVDVKRKSIKDKVHHEVFDIDEALDIENSRASSFQVRNSEVADLWSRKTTLLATISNEVVGFDSIKELYTRDEDFCNSWMEFEAKQHREQDGTVGEYKWMTYRESCIARLEVGLGLLYHGIPKGSTRLYFNNRPEWVIVDNACSVYSYIYALLYDALGLDAATFIGDNLKLKDDMASLRPTLFFSVPRVYNKLYVDITNVVKSSGGLKQSLFNTAYNAKKYTILNGKNSYAIWDILFFNKIKGMLGGQVCLMLSAALPLSADVLDFLRVCFGCIFLEAYGMTKIYCAISIIDLDDNLCGHIGSPSLACEINLVDGYYKDEFHFEDVNKGKHSRMTSSKERGNDGYIIQELAEEYIDMIQEHGKSKSIAKNKQP
ncbi:long chain acyl-CoA synthetase 6, peroxisomal-like protein [Tanacetum coccineum]